MSPEKRRATITRLAALLPGRSDYELNRGWGTDMLAGVTVAVVALPLALAFGVASGVGATAGLVTAIVAGAVAAVFGRSSLQVSGPTGAMTVVLVPIVAERGVGSVATIALLAGLLVVAAGVLGLGKLVTLIPVAGGGGLHPWASRWSSPPSRYRWLSAWPSQAGGNAAMVAGRAVARFAENPHVAVLLLLALAVVLTAVLPRPHRSLPASLIAVAATTVAAVVSGADFAVIGDLPRTLPVPSRVGPLLDDGPVVAGARGGPRRCSVGCLRPTRSPGPR